MDTSYPASPYQRRLWSIGAAGPGFQAEGVIRVEGCAGAELSEALEQVVLRHGALRTWLAGIHSAPFAVQSVAAATQAGPQTKGRTWLAVEHQELEPGSHRLTLRMPSAVLDPPSFAIIARELAALLGGQMLEQDPIQFVEFSDWRNEVVGDDAFPAGQPATPQPGEFAVHRAREDLSPALQQAIEGVASAAGVLAPDVLLAAWMTYLWRFGTEQTCTVRTADDSRSTDPALQGVVGRVAAYLPVTAALGRGMPFLEAVKLVGEARAATGSAGERRLANSPAGTAAFDVAPAGERHTSGAVTVHLYSADARTEPFGERLTWSPGTGDLALELDAAKWPPAAAGRALAGVITLAGAATTRPTTPLGKLPMLGAEEGAWLTQVSHGPERTIGETAISRITNVARTHPERLAARDRGIRLRYRELLERASQVAGALAGAGVQRGDTVVVVADHSVWSLVAILGVMLAGAAYVPLDEGMPTGRLQTIIEDCGARVVLAGGKVELPGSLARLNPATATSPAGAPAASRTLDDTAYILYTSGSTGRPKGVIVSDRGLANYLGWAADHYRMAGPGEALVTSPFGFDLTVTTLLAPLTAGGTVVIAPNASPVDVLADVDPERGLSVLKLTPRHLDLLTSHLSGAEIGRVGTVVIGGEPLSRPTVSRWRALCGGSVIVNEYGPTETVVGSAFHDVQPDGDVHPDVPIGRPIANTSLYVLDQDLQPVPCGMAGELFIAGAGVARGYLSAPAQTAERFLPNPFADDGTPMYRTGDMVRRDHNGDLTYVGRVDAQIKIRGYRVEPGEVEQVLVAAGGVRAAAVVPSGQALIAFIVPDGEGQDDPALLAHAAAWLPEYMVPARIVRVPALPLTPNGKVDRAALARNARSSPGGARPPETEMERLVEEVWRTVLDVDFVSLDESFFEIGGESLLAIEVMRQLQERLDRKLRVVTLFEHPTVRRLAASLACQDQDDGAAQAGADRAARRANARARGPQARRQP